MVIMNLIEYIYKETKKRKDSFKDKIYTTGMGSGKSTAMRFLIEKQMEEERLKLERIMKNRENFIQACKDE